MIAEQQFHHAFARLLDLRAVGGDHHAFADDRRTRGLQLGHFLDPHQAHAAGALQGQIGVIAERRDFDAHFFAGFNEQSARGNRELFAVNCERNVRHNSLRFLIGHLRFRTQPCSLDFQITDYQSQNHKFFRPSLAVLLPHPHPQTDTVCPPSGPQIPF